MTVLRRAAALLVATLALMASAGCGKNKIPILPVDNIPPVVRITAAPIDSNAVCSPGQAHSCYSLTLDWVGYDADGRVDHYIYAIDPPADADTTWITTTDHEKRLTFDAPSISPNKTHANDSLSVLRGYHVFVVAAVDNDHAEGARAFRAFFSFTNAPTVDITSPRPQGLVPQLPPSVRISWTGKDPDGIFSDKPTRYKYILLGPSDAARITEIVNSKGDAIRKYYAPEFRADQGWVSVRGDTTSVQLTDLVPSQQDKYLFAVAAFDEAGAFSPVFSFQHNILQFRVGFANTNGPTLTVFNESFFYTFPPVYDPGAEVRIEQPAGAPVTFNWVGTAPQGADIVGYRWMLDGDVFDTHPRSDENTDLSHWSALSSTQSATIGPFASGEHFLYIDVLDNTGLKSLAVLHLSIVVPTFSKPLVVIDDTRYEPDGFSTDGTPIPYGYQWPAAAELDTFMYAVGGVPWKGNNVDTTPGIFHGYSFDTLGTRRGLSDLGVPLSYLGQFQHVVWLIDQASALMSSPGSVTVNPSTSLRYMSALGHLNALGAYIRMGGAAWLVGGGGAMATLIAFDVSGNNGGGGRMVWASGLNSTELRPGRFMFDAVKWKSSIFDRVGVPIQVADNQTILRNLGRFTTNPGIYSGVPVSFNRRSQSGPNADPVPPRRLDRNFNTTAFGGEIIGSGRSTVNADNIVTEPVLGEPRDFRIDKFDDASLPPIVKRWPSTDTLNLRVGRDTLLTPVGRASAGTLKLTTTGGGAATGNYVSLDFGKNPRDLSGLTTVRISLKQNQDASVLHWSLRVVDTHGGHASVPLDPVAGGQFADLAVEQRFFTNDASSPFQTNFVRIQKVQLVLDRGDAAGISQFDNLEFSTIPDGAVLDTLLVIKENLGNPPPISATMTIYHGKDFVNPVIFTGFAPWDFRRAECKALFDFVLQKVWGLSPNATASATRSLATFAPAHRLTTAAGSDIGLRQSVVPRGTPGAGGLRRAVKPLAPSRREGNP